LRGAITALEPLDGMRILGPACSSTYDVPDTLLRPGGKVRCARCGDEWVPLTAGEPEPPPPRYTPPPQDRVIEAEALPDEPDLPHFTAMDRLAISRTSRRRSRLALGLAWMASILAVLLLLAAGFVWRAQIAAAWPPSARLYSTLGVLPAPPATR
jgi:predicted Zn finger-like uncharacterized protein